MKIIWDGDISETTGLAEAPDDATEEEIDALVRNEILKTLSFAWWKEEDQEA